MPVSRLSRLRLAKYVVRAASIIILMIIILSLAGPLLGFETQRYSTNTIGFSVDTKQLGPQIDAILSSGSALTQPHQVTLPVSNVWVFSADVKVEIDLQVAGAVVYSTSGTLTLQAFQSGQIVIPFQLPQGEASQLPGNEITIGGGMIIGDPSFLWTITVPFARGGS